MNFYVLVIFIIVCNAIAGAWQVLGGTAKEEEKWVHPDALAKEFEGLSDSGYCKCYSNPAADTPDVSQMSYQAAAFVLQKFIRKLFSRDKLQYDAKFALYQRNILFTIIPTQLEMLESLEDPRDLDGVLEEIFKNMRTPDDMNESSGSWSRIFALIWDIVKDCVLLLRFSEVRFISFVALAVLAGWFVHRKHNISIFVITISGIFLFGYFHTYLECNRELEMKQTLEAIEHIESLSKPAPAPSWYSPISAWFGSSPEQVVKHERREKIKKESRLILTFCRPDHVLIRYVNDLFLKQLEFFIEKCTITIERVKDNLGFPWNVMAVASLLAMIVFTVKLTFEHILSPRVWTGYFRRGGSNAVDSKQHQQALSDINGDRISGENLKILLTAIARPSNVLLKNEASFSCAQDVLEALDAPQDDSSNISNSSSNSYTSLNEHLKKNLISSIEADELSEKTASTLSAFVETLTVDGSETITKSNPNQSTAADFVIVSNANVSLQDLPNDQD